MKTVRIPLIAAVSLSLFAVGCTSSTTTTVAPTSTATEATTSTTLPVEPSGTGAVTFERQFVPGESLFAADGEAVDLGLICATATGEEVGQEDADGNAVSEAQEDALFNGSEPFISVTVEELTCDDASGSFILRIGVAVDPTDPDWSPDTADATWTITGGTGYETTTGEGEDTELGFVDGVDVVTASGIISRSG